MSDGSGAEAGLVGEHAALHAPHDNHHGRAYRAACDALRAESTHEDVVEHFTQSAGMINQHDDTGNDINHGHEGNQLLGDVAQTLHAAQNHDAHQDGQHNAQHQV